MKASIGRFTLGLVSSYDTEHRLHATLAKHIFKASAGEVVILTLWDCRSDQHQYVTGSKIDFLAERSLNLSVNLLFATLYFCSITFI